MKTINMNREDLLERLQMVLPGVSPQDLLEQSSCFVFQDGRVMTYNDEVACSTDTPGLNFTGAVVAKPLISALRLLREDTIKIEVNDDELKIYGKRKILSFAMESEVLLSLETVNVPTERKAWKPVPEDLCAALDIVRQCAGQDESLFSLTCVHIAPDWVEACDNFHLSRFPLETGLKESALVRREGISHIGASVFDKWALGDSWVHFLRSYQTETREESSTLVVSIRRYTEDFPDLASLINVEGEKVTLPKSIDESSKLGEVFTAEADENLLQVDVTTGRMRLSGEGPGGKFKQTFPIKYEGERFSFAIPPRLLREIVSRAHECEINERVLKVNGGKFVYITSLKETVKED